MNEIVLIVFIGLLVGYVIVATALAIERDRHQKVRDERDQIQARCVRLEAKLREKDALSARLESFQDRGWRVVVKSHAYVLRDEAGRSVDRNAWGWLVTVLPIDRQRYARWGVLTGAVMGTLQDALDDTDRRVRQIEGLERDEKVQRETMVMTYAEQSARFDH